MDAEAELLAAIARGDPDSRLVYADWLEQRGDAARAALLRLQETPIGPERLGRLRELARSVDPTWRRVIARTAVAGCERGDCAMDWGTLARTDRDTVRSCRRCGQKVRYADDEAELARFLGRGDRAVRDPAIALAHLTVDGLAGLDAEAWEGYALALAAGAACEPLEPRRPPPLDWLAASRVEGELAIAGGDDGRYHGFVEPTRWLIGVGPLDDDTAAVARDAGIDGELLRFAHIDGEHGGLVASWRSGDRDAMLHKILDVYREPIVKREVCTARAWLAEVIDGLLLPDPDGFEVTASAGLTAALRDTLVRAFDLRETLRSERAAAVAAIEAAVGAGDDDALLARWAAASAALAAVAATPGLWRRLADPDE
jgi:uncharacterized protein (TIGR02996 family)